MDFSTVTTLNLNKICRICLLETPEMHSIFSEIQNEDNPDDESTFVYEILMNISAVRILTPDRMPTMICTNCLEVANTAYRFQQQCNRSQAILEAYLTQIDIGAVDEDATEADAAKNRNEPESQDKLTTLLEPIEPSKGSSCSLDTSNDDIDVDNYFQNSDEEDSFVESENLGNKVPELDLVKVEIKEESVLDAVQVAALEDNVKLKQKLALKRMQSKNGDPKGCYKRMQPRTKFSYYVRTNENGEKIYACNMCDKSYKFGSSLKVHMRSHTLERPYCCTLCDKSFKQYGSLSYHLRSHTGEQPYICNICGKRYKQSGTLTAHMRIHTGQRPFLCSVCGRGFRQAPDLRYHMRTHTKEKPYMCNICGKTMSMQCHLVQHMRIHTGERPFKCTECSKAFPSSTRLKRHAIIHTGLKPYTCDVCDKSFNRRSSLRVHAKIHTDERPHVCPICGKGFIQAHSLKSHVVTHSSANFAQTD